MSGRSRRMSGEAILAVAVAALVSCTAPEGLTGPRPERAVRPVATHVRYDGSVPGGHPNFRWVAPMTTVYSPLGKADGKLAPHLTVKVCRLLDDGCPIVSVHTSTTPGYGQLALNSDSTAFKTVWATVGQQVGTYRASVELLGQELGYALVKVRAELMEGETDIQVLLGRSLSIRFWVGPGMSGTSTVGSAGGSAIDLGTGSLLSVPAGVLAGPISMTLRSAPLDGDAPALMLTFPASSAPLLQSGETVTLRVGLGTSTVGQTWSMRARPAPGADDWYTPDQVIGGEGQYLLQFPASDLALAASATRDDSVRIQLIPQRAAMTTGAGLFASVIVDPTSRPKAGCREYPLDEISEGAAGSETMVVFVHGWQPRVDGCPAWLREQEDDDGNDVRFGLQYWKRALDGLDEMTDANPSYVFSYPSDVSFRATGHTLAQRIRGIAVARPEIRGVIFIGHSMGGLVSRVAASELESEEGALEVVGILTLATPHLGTPAPRVSWLAGHIATGANYNGAGTLSLLSCTAAAEEGVPCNYPLADTRAPVFAFGGDPYWTSGESVVCWRTGPPVPQPVYCLEQEWRGDLALSEESYFMAANLVCARLAVSPCTADGPVPTNSALPTRPSDVNWHNQLTYQYDHSEMRNGDGNGQPSDEPLIQRVREIVDSLIRDRAGTGDPDEACAFGGTALVACWLLDGSPIDAGVNSLDGTLQGGTPVANRHGAADRAMRFAGAATGPTYDQGISVPSNPLLSDASMSEVTVVAWVRTSNVAGYTKGWQRIAGKGRAYEYSYSLYLADGYAALTAWQFAGADHLIVGAGSTLVADGEWHQLVGVIRNGSFARVYVDGVLDGEDLTPNGTWYRGGSGDFTIARWPSRFPDQIDHHAPFDGDLDDIRVIRRALTAQEVAALFAAERP